MISRILKKPIDGKSFFLLGPRGTGKTHWVKEELPNAIYIDLLKTETYLEFLANPSRLESFIPPGLKDWIVIDEVQRIPDLLNEVHRLIEQNNYKFVLTGSSARSLRKKGINLLAGRALMYKMHPLTVQELGDKFDLKRSLQYGNLPAVLTEPNPKAYLSAYVNTYLREEVLQEGLTRNLAAFSRFLEIASFSQGSIINMTEIAREVGIQRKVVASYFEILEDLLLGYRLPVFIKRAQRKTTQHPKYYLFDAGIYQTVRPKGLLDSTAEIGGAAVETLFFQELLAINDYLQLGYQIYYWQLQNKTEVDFIVYGEKGFYAFEIKSSERVDLKDCKGLLSFAEEYPEAKLYLIYCGNEPRYFGNIEVLPITSALKRLPEILNA